jgi:phage tail sheath protein FI
MPTYLAPGTYVEERSSGIKPIEGVSTSIAAFVGVAERGPVGSATFVTSFSEFVKRFGGPLRVVPGVQEHYLYYAVRHFFRQGGTKCYVVRVLAYADVDDASTIKAETASLDVTGVAGGVAGPGVRVAALNPGAWGNAIEVRARASTRFSVGLAADVPSGTTDHLLLVDNPDVREGDLLYVVEQVGGVVKSADADSGSVSFKSVTFRPGTVTSGGTAFAGTLNAGKTAFTPDFGLVTTVATATGSGGTSPDPVLGDVFRNDGVPLRTGDVVNFATAEAMIVVTKVTPQTVGGLPVVRVDFAAHTLPAFTQAAARAYQRGFTLDVRVDGDVVETHEHLSLVAADRVDHVAVRLPPESQGTRSAYVTAEDQATDETTLVPSAPFTALANGKDALDAVNDPAFVGSDVLKTGLHALDRVEDASILCIPNASANVSSVAIGYCERRKDLFYVVDQPSSSTASVVDYVGTAIPSSSYAALYHPWIVVEDVLTGREIAVPPSGAVAGVYADTDIRRGVHKAPAGIDTGVLAVARRTQTIVTPGENDLLYQHRINVIRTLPEGIVVWGARTLAPDPEWKYVNVRRLFIFLEQSIERGTQWVVFEPNDATLWKSIRRNVTAFLRIQWLQGALVGIAEKEAFFVKCDAETNPPEVVEAGQVVAEIGVAPSKPAEFVVFRIKQIAGVAPAI